MTGAAEARSVTVERDFPYPPARLWRALTRKHLIAEWLMANDFEAVVGHRFNLKGEWGGVLDCEVLAMEPERTLSWRWDFTHDDPAYDLRSVVTFTLTPTETGTRLSMEQKGFRPEQKQASGGARLGWSKFLGQLDALLARGD